MQRWDPERVVSSGPTNDVCDDEGVCLGSDRTLLRTRSLQRPALLVSWVVFLGSLFAVQPSMGQRPDAVVCPRPNTVVCPRPNILFIAIDDLNDWIGCMGGHPQARTPHLDALADRGILFTNAHCVAPACNPSRAALFSGRMPFTTGVWSNASEQKLDRIYPQAKLLPQALRDSGYTAWGTGKLLHAGGKHAFDAYQTVSQRWSPLSPKAVRYTSEELPSKGTDHPFHTTRDPLGRKVVLPLNRMPSDRKPDSDDGESFDWGPWDLPDRYFGDTQITDWAIERLRSAPDRPLFLGIGYYRPHIPLWAPKRYFARFRSAPAQLPPVLENDLDDLSPTARHWALEPVTAGAHATVVQHGQWGAAVEAYLACIAYVDAEVGRLIAALDRSPLADTTWIILWSDHGWHLGEKQHWGKWTGWERSTRVPLIFVPPRNLASEFAPPGSRCDAPVSLIDLYPTVLQVCNVPAPGRLDGQSLVPQLHEPGRPTDRAVLTTFDPGNISVRTQRWRYIRYDDGSEELYDHRSDPHEWYNLAGRSEYIDTLQRMRSRASALVPQPSR